MKLINIKGDTYYIKGGTNTGVVKLDEDNVLIIDPGLGGLRPKKIMGLLKENNMKISHIINTHEHEDHYEGCNQIKINDETIQILSSKEAKIYIDFPHKFADSILGGKSNILLNPKVSDKKGNLIKIDNVVSEGNIVLNNKKVEINKIKNLEFEYMVLGHSKKIYSKEESKLLIKSHSDAINKYINQVRELLKSPITIDNILKNIINNNNLYCNYTQYYFFRSTIISIISYLCDLNQVDYSIKLGEMLYYSKKA